MATVAEASIPRPAPDPMWPRVLTLVRSVVETPDTFTMELAAPDGVEAFPFQAGQFNMVGVPGVGEVPISISGDPRSPRSVFHTTREVGAVTRALKKLRPGAPVTVRGPFGQPWPVESARDRDVVLIAGGIGLAPLRPVIDEVMAKRTDYGRFLLLYGTRTPKDIIYAKQLARWRAHFSMELLITVDRGTGDWRGNVGFVSTLVGRAPFDPLDTIAMVCGPEVMMRTAVHELKLRGVPSDHIWLSMERNMKCGIGLCGHCQLRGEFVCRTGPVYRYDRIAQLLEVREL